MGQINTNNYPTVESLADADLLIVENSTNGTGTTTPKQLREHAIGTDPLQTTSQTVTGAINELKREIDEGGGSAVIGNPSDTASSILDKIKIGSRTYDASAIKPYTATNITTSAITISIGLAEDSALNGRIIAVNTGNRSGTPSNAWGLNILYNGGGSSVGCAILKSDGTAFTDAVTANEVLFLSMDMTNLEATIVNIAGASGGGASALSDLTDVDVTSPTDGQVLTYSSTTGKWENQTGGGTGNTKLKTRYSISYLSWSSSPNSDGYYTYSLTLSPTINTSISPDVLIAGSNNITHPTDTEKTMFNYVKRCYLSGGTLTLYANTKPTSTFYVYVEGVAGSGSGSIVGNVIQPNGRGVGNVFQSLIDDTPIVTFSAKKSELTAASSYYNKVWDMGESYPTWKQKIKECNLILIEVGRYNSSADRYMREGTYIVNVNYKYNNDYSMDQINCIVAQGVTSDSKYSFFTDGNWASITVNSSSYAAANNDNKYIAKLYKLS